MRKRYLILIILSAAFSFRLAAQLFVQDFSASSIVSDYVNAAPNNTQFTYIAASGAGVGISINNGTLELVRTGANGGYVCRNADFSPVPSLLKVVFDLEVPAATTTTSSAAIFRFGQGYGNDNNTPANLNTHSRLSINLVGSEGFQVRDIATGINSATFNGIQTITWWINNSGSSASYTGPDGSTNTVADDRNDVWIGNTLAFDELTVVTPTVSVTDFKIVYDSGSGTIRFDNFLMTTETSLPVELDQFFVTRVGAEARLDWSTFSERNNDYFAVERSQNGKDFAEIGKVKGTGASREIVHYQFADRQPEPGLNYYRLRQVDLDGAVSYSPVRVLVFGSATVLRILPSPASEFIQIQWSEPPAGAEVIAWEIYDAAARRVKSGAYEPGSSPGQVSIGDLPGGAYMLRATCGHLARAQAFIKN